MRSIESKSRRVLGHPRGAARRARGGQALIASLIEHATVPYVLDGDGNCHIYIDGAADLGMALELAINAKTHRFGV